jgi:diguanylate cyclase (GGDEF)-like protein
LLKVLDEELTTADREHAGMLYIDVNHFKEINDTLGHDVGDQALRIVAERIRAVKKVRDVAVRLHGDEFAVLTLQLAQLNHLQAIAERISEAVSEPTELPGAARLLSVSVGGVYQLPPNVRFGGVLKMSDRLMYAVKRNGGAHPIVLPYREAQAQAYVSHP